MALFEIPKAFEDYHIKKNAEIKKEQKNKVKLKGSTNIFTLIESARATVNEKLGKYKETSKLVTDIKEVENFFNQDNEFIAIDTETTGLNTFTDLLVGFSVCNGKECLYIPVRHINYGDGSILKDQISVEDIQNLFKHIINKDIKWIYHNAKFDLAVFRTFLGFDMPDPYWDTMICSCLFNQEEDHNLKYLYNTYISQEDEGINKFDTLFKGLTFNYIPMDIATIYAGKDAFMTYEIFKYQYVKLQEDDLKGIKYVFEEIEMPILPILVGMQRHGVSISNKKLNELQAKYNKKLEDAKIAVYKELEPYEKEINLYKLKNYNHKLDTPINLASSSQLSTLFYKIIKYKTKAGKGTGEEILNEINTPLTKALLEFRKMEKLVKAFLISLPKRIEPSTGRIHTSLNQYGAATGRFSSSDPNMQQIPSKGEGKEIRQVFCAKERSRHYNN